MPRSNSQPESKISIIKEITKDSELDRNLLPSEFINKYWNIYQDKYGSANISINGGIFEELIAITLQNKGIIPFYMQAKVAFIPNVNYDFILYNKSQVPISLSCKVSLRERWKQADLEAVALRYIHRNATSYLISLSKGEVNTRKQDIGSCMGLNDFILAISKDYDDLLDNLAKETFIKAGTIEIIKSNIFVESNKLRFLQ